MVALNQSCLSFQKGDDGSTEKKFDAGYTTIMRGGGSCVIASEVSMTLDWHLIRFLEVNISVLGGDAVYHCKRPKCGAVGGLLGSLSVTFVAERRCVIIFSLEAIQVDTKLKEKYHRLFLLSFLGSRLPKNL